MLVGDLDDELVTGLTRLPRRLLRDGSRAAAARATRSRDAGRRAAVAYAARLRACPVPALVAWGERDSVFPISRARPLADAFVDARVLVLSGGRHPAHLDQPELFQRELVDFVKRVSRRRPAPVE